MHIYHVSAATLPSETANSIQVMRMAAALAAIGHEVTLFCRRGARGDDPHDYYGVPRTFELVPVRWPPVRGLGSAWYARALAAAVRERGAPDAFYGRHMLSLAALLGVGRPVLAEAHSAPPGHLHHLLERHLLRSPLVARLFTVSHALRAEYLLRFPRLDPARVVVAPNGGEPPAQAVAPRELPGRPSAPRVGYVGHLYPGKGLELIDLLARQMPHVDFHVFGGTERDRAHWRAAAPHANLLLHPHLPPRDVPATLEAFTIALAPYQRRVSVSGGGDDAKWMSPLKVFEYMASAKAIVASDLPVIRELLQEGETAVLASPDDPGQWRAAIQRLLDRPELARALGTRARARVLAHHTWTDRARLIADAIQASASVTHASR